MKTRLAKWGENLGVRIPKAVALAANLKVGDELEVTAEGIGKLKIRSTKQPPAPPLEELLSRIRPENLHIETDW